jgi:hypothetical protein
VTRQILNVAVLLVVLWFNAMAGAGTLSGESIGLIANRYTSFFLPANYVFGIWSLIYLALVAFTVYQALPAQRSGGAAERVGWWWAVNGLLNIGWVVLFSFSLFGPAMVLMACLLVNLAVLHVRIADSPEPMSLGDRTFVAWVFDLYFAWISVAIIANTFQYVTFLEWGGWVLGAEAWSAVMMAVATAFGGFMAIRRGSWIFPLVVVWAVFGIGDRFQEVPLILWTAYLMVPVGLVLTAVSAFRTRSV